MACVRLCFAGGGPEVLSVLLEGECLLNDASSLTLFEIFKHILEGNEQRTIGKTIADIVETTIWAAAVGVMIGVALGIVTR